VVRKFAARHPELRLLINEQNLGPGPTRNKGWNLASSDFVAFLDADDSWHPQKLELQLKFFAENPGEVACGTTHQSAGQTRATQITIDSTSGISKFSLNDLLRRNRFSTPSTMLRHNITQRFDPDLRLAEDYLLWMSIAADHGHVSRIDQQLTILHKPEFGARGLSGKMFAMFVGELNAFGILFRDKKIKVRVLVACYAWSTIKFVRRLPLAAYRKIFAR